MGALAARARARARLKGSAQPILFHQVLVGFLDSLQSFHSRIESRLNGDMESSVNARWQMPQAPSRGQDAPIGPWPATGCVVCLVTDPRPVCAKKRGQGPPRLRLLWLLGSASPRPPNAGRVVEISTRDLQFARRSRRADRDAGVRTSAPAGGTLSTSAARRAPRRALRRLPAGEEG